MHTIARRPLVMGPALIAAATVGFAATLDGEDGQTFCLFRRCSGGYCPGCGGGRATAALLRGDLAGSWTVHPWVPLLAIQLVIALIVGARFGHDRLRAAVLPLLVGNLVLGVVIWSVRLMTGSIPIPFG